MKKSSAYAASAMPLRAKYAMATVPDRTSDRNMETRRPFADPFATIRLI